MDLTTATDFASTRNGGVLITLKRDGRPQASNINFTCDTETVRISVTADRAKTKNLQRDPRASLHVTSDDFWSWVVLEGRASLSPVATPDDPDTLDALRQLYRDAAGKEHPDWDDYDRAMIADRRQVLTITLERAYGQLSQSG